MSVKRFLLCVFAVFLLLMLNFTMVYGAVAVMSADGFPIVGPECGTIAIGLLALELLLLGFAASRRNRRTQGSPADPPAREEMLSEELYFLSRHAPGRSASHSVRSIRPKQILVPLACVLTFIFGGIAAIYLSFHYFVFDLEYRGDPAVFGEEYRDARVVTSTFDRQYSQQIFMLETADGEQTVLAFDGSDFHPGRFRMPSTEMAGVPGTGGRVAVQNPMRNSLAWLEIVLLLLLAPAAFALSWYLARQNKPKQPEGGSHP